MFAILNLLNSKKLKCLQFFKILNHLNSKKLKCLQFFKLLNNISNLHGVYSLTGIHCFKAQNKDSQKCLFLIKVIKQ